MYNFIHVLNVILDLSVVAFCVYFIKRMTKLEDAVIRSVMEESEKSGLSKHAKMRKSILGIMGVTTYPSACFIGIGIAWDHIGVALTIFLMIATIFTSIGVILTVSIALGWGED